MFFGKLFKKNHSHYLTQAGKHLAAERFADARFDFLEALKRCPGDAVSDEREIRAGLNAAGDSLGLLNLQEGEHALQAVDLVKAFDHFTLAGELAVDEKIKVAARAKLASLQQSSAAAPIPSQGPSAHKAHGGSSCASCKDAGSHQPAEQNQPDSNLSEEDRFFLMIQPLQGDLAARYAALGEKFATAYLLVHDGNDTDALPILREILTSGDNDIVIYEVALIMYRAGQLHECEALLNRSLSINPGNSMSYLALVQLRAETGRYAEAIATVDLMMGLGIMPDQGQLMLGELQEAAGNEAAAFEAFTAALALPAVARSAAERLIPMLDKQGRLDEAKFLAKRYLKGCC